MSTSTKDVEKIRRLCDKLPFDIPLKTPEPFSIETVYGGEYYKIIEVLKHKYSTPEKLKRILYNYAKYNYESEVLGGAGIFFDACSSYRSLRRPFIEWCIPKKFVGDPFSSIKVSWKMELDIPSSIELFYFLKKIEDYEPGIYKLILDDVLYTMINNDCIKNIR